VWYVAYVVFGGRQGPVVTDATSRYTARCYQERPRLADLLFLASFPLLCFYLRQKFNDHIFMSDESAPVSTAILMAYLGFGTLVGAVMALASSGHALLDADWFSSLSSESGKIYPILVTTVVLGIVVIELTLLG
jgi:hypothetical protein